MMTDALPVSMGEMVRIIDPSTGTLVASGEVCELDSKYFGVDAGGVAPRRFNFWTGGQVKPVDRPHTYHLEVEG